MRYSFVPTAAALLISTAAIGQKDGQNLFDSSFLHEIKIESDTPGFFGLLVSTWAANILDVPDGQRAC